MGKHAHLPLVFRVLLISQIIEIEIYIAMHSASPHTVLYHFNIPTTRVVCPSNSHVQYASGGKGNVGRVDIAYTDRSLESRVVVQVK